MAKPIYNWAHQQARKRALAALIDGTPCHLCGYPMYREQASQLHLDHHPAGHGYRGLAHQLCNVTDGASRGGRATYRKTHGLPPETGNASRNW